MNICRKQPLLKDYGVRSHLRTVCLTPVSVGRGFKEFKVKMMFVISLLDYFTYHNNVLNLYFVSFTFTLTTILSKLLLKCHSTCQL